MKMLLSLVVFALVVLGLPIYISYIFTTFQAHKWVRSVVHTVIALLIAAGLFFLTYFGLATQTAPPTKPKLTYLTKPDLDEEVKLQEAKKMLNGQTFDPALKIIKAKFDKASYAETKRDFSIAVDVWNEIKVGSDENGPFQTFHSACIENNLAVDYFATQGDKKFLASSLLFDALRLEPKPKHLTDIIQQNLDAMDHFLNQ